MKTKTSRLVATGTAILAMVFAIATPGAAGGEPIGAGLNIEELASAAFAEPVAGNDTVGTATYPFLPVRRGAAALITGEVYPCGAVIDTIHGYAYFGTVTVPGQVVKVALGDGSSAPVRVGSVSLNAGEDFLRCGVIDPVRGYAYFGTDKAPGRVVKVALGEGSAPPTRVGAVTLNEGEYALRCAVIDDANGYAYFGTDTAPGHVVKVALGAGNSAPRRVGAATLPEGEYAFRSAAIDAANGYAYFGTNTAPGRVVKVALGAGSSAPWRAGALTLNAGENFLLCAAIDTGHGYAYFGTDTSPGQVVKVALGAGLQAPTRVGASTVDWSENNFHSTVIDANKGYIYFGTIGGDRCLIKFALGAGSAAPSHVAALYLPGERRLECGVIDSAKGYAYFGSAMLPFGKVVKVALGDGASPPSRVGGITLDEGEPSLRCGVVDEANGYAYFGTDTSPGRIVKVMVGSGASAPVRVGALTLDSGENNLRCAVIDALRGYAYFGTGTSPGKVVKVALGGGASAPSRVGAITLDPGENDLQSAVIDTDNGYAYFGPNTSPGRVVKVALGSGDLAPTRVGAATLSPEEYCLISAAIDTENAYVYFGTGTMPGRIVKVALGEGATPPLRSSATTLLGLEDNPHSCVIDKVSKYLYFGVGPTLSRVVKVALGEGATSPTRVGAVFLPPTEWTPVSGVIDTANRYSYWGTSTKPGWVVKVAPGDEASAPSRVSSVVLNLGEDDLYSAVIDTIHGYAYWGTYTTLAQVVKTALGLHDRIWASKMTVSDVAAVKEMRIFSRQGLGNLRLAIYTDAPTNKKLLWQSEATSNTVSDGWLCIPIASGTPASLRLWPGTYWLAFQTNTRDDAASYLPGASGMGFDAPFDWGAFPSSINSQNLTGVTWSQYITYDVEPSDDWIAPESRVLAPSGTTSEPLLTVQWTAEDVGTTQSGVRSVEVFWSRDGDDVSSFGAFPAWTTSTVFDASGPGFGTYSFYSVATDVAGNVEAAPLQPDTSVTIRLAAPQIALEPFHTKGVQNTVYWSNSPWATGYTVQCDEAQDFAALFKSAVVSETTYNYTFTGLEDGETYWYRARAETSYGAPSDWSDPVFSTQDAVAPVSQVVAPEGRTTESWLMVRWTSSDPGQNPSGVHSVGVAYRKDLAAWTTMGAYPGEVSSAKFNIKALGYGTYAFRSVATDAASNVETVPTSPDVSVIVEKANPQLFGEPLWTSGTQNTLYWTESPWATGFTIQCDDADDFASLFNSATLPESTYNYTFSDLEDGQTYWYRVRAETSYGSPGDWSPPAFSTQDAMKPASQVVAPTGTTTDTRLTIEWTASDPGSNPSGVKSAGVYWNKDYGAFRPLGFYPATTSRAVFDTSAHGFGTYAFYSVATDAAGNVEAAPERADVTVAVIAPSELANLSTRGWVGAGNNVMIAGFQIEGPNPKRVLVTAWGPSLSNFGVPGALADPALTVYSNLTPLCANNDWGDSPDVAAIIATGNQPLLSSDSAVLVTLADGDYTAIVSGAASGVGNGMVAVWDADTTESWSVLRNISTRCWVGAGDNVTIAGLIVRGSVPKRVGITGWGPSLSAFGVPDALADPRVGVFAGQTPLAASDNWQDSPMKDEIIAAGIAPANGLESALILTLAPGAYTAVLSGGTGNGLIAVWNLE